MQDWTCGSRSSRGTPGSWCECDLTGYDGLCLIGGDGTVHEVASGMIERGESASLPLGVIPAGTGNDVARQLGVSGPLKPPDGLSRADASVRRGQGGSGR